MYVTAVLLCHLWHHKPLRERVLQPYNVIYGTWISKYTAKLGWISKYTGLLTRRCREKLGGSLDQVMDNTFHKENTDSEEFILQYVVLLT